MELQVLSSGSSGNCYALNNGKETLLLEAGLPIEKIIDAIDISKVNSCLISHEHKDHSMAMQDLTKYGINVYASKGTFDSSVTRLNHRMKLLEHKKMYTIGTYKVLAFDLVHDAVDPLGFIIQDTISKEKLLFATDTWYLKYKFPDIQYWLIECNYNKSILDSQIEDKTITRNTLDRIRTSHMSLEMLEETLLANDLTSTYYIVLLHLSDSRANEKEMVRRIQELTGIKTVSASSKPLIKLTKTAW